MFSFVKVRIIFTLLFAAVTSPVISQPENQTPAGVSDEKALEILGKVSDKYKGYPAFKGSYVYSVDYPEKETDEEYAGMFYMKAGKYKIASGDQEIICDGETVWYWLKKVKEVQVNNYEPDNSTFTPDKLFFIYDQEFLSWLSEEIREGTQTLLVIEMTPREKSRPYFKIKVYIDKVTYDVVRAKVFDKNGNRYTYSLSDLMADPALTDSFFSFNPKEHPGVEVVDLR